MLAFTMYFEGEAEPSVSISELENMHLADTLDYDCRFEMHVCGEILFSQDVSILELAQCFQKWLKKPKKSLIYNTVEREENPFIAFHKQKDGWKISSVWQKFECKEIFSFEDVENFVKGVVDYVVTDKK